MSANADLVLENGRIFIGLDAAVTDRDAHQRYRGHERAFLANQKSILMGA